MTFRIKHTVQVWKEGDTYVARAMPLDVMSCGDTLEQARKHLIGSRDYPQGLRGVWQESIGGKE